MQQIKKKKENLANRFKKPRLADNQHESLYYSSWIGSALHVITSIPTLQTEEKIGERLKLPLELVRENLSLLSSLGAVKKQGDLWTATQRSLHLPNESPLIAMHHANWRMKAALDAQYGDNGSLHYTAIHALSRKDIERIKEVILACLDQMRSIVEPSPEEEVICFNCDLFKI